MVRKNQTCAEMAILLGFSGHLIDTGIQMTAPENAAPTRILLVEDDRRFCLLLQQYLREMGYAVSVCHNGPEGLQMALAETFHAILLDVMLPGMDGFEVLRRLRAHSMVPVLMLTGRGEEADRIVGLELGADDYLPKTFSMRELLARLRAVLRRSIFSEATRAEAGEPVVAGELSIDPATHTATLAGTVLSLTAHEFEMLLSLARVPGRVKTREQLLLEVSDRDFEVFDRSVDVLISSLRRKLGDDPKEPRWIETVRGVGYVLRRAEPG